MDLRLLYFDGCPHAAVAEEHLRAALSSLGRDADIARVLVESADQAEALGFIGSPTVLVDGWDPFARGDEPAALVCRVFTTPEGLAGTPAVEQFVQVLSKSV